MSVAILVFSCPYFVQATSWWGIGARPHKWILSHGGTLINFDIENYSGDKREYKAVMYDKKGKYVEAEWGLEGIFDDAKDGVYTIKAKRGESTDFGVKDNREEGKTFATIKITAHPGERIRIKFDYKKKSAKMTTDYVAPVAKIPAKPVPVSEPQEIVVESVQAEEALEISSKGNENIENLFLNEERDIFAKFEDFVHPDALAKETRHLAIKPNPKDLVREEAEDSFWAKMIKTISDWYVEIVKAFGKNFYFIYLSRIL